MGVVSTKGVFVLMEGGLSRSGSMSDQMVPCCV